MIFYVLASWAVTPLTGNSQDKIVLVVVIVGGLGTGLLEVGGMTLEAAGAARHSIVENSDRFQHPLELAGEAELVLSRQVPVPDFVGEFGCYGFEDGEAAAAKPQDLTHKNAQILLGGGRRVGHKQGCGVCR